MKQSLARTVPGLALIAAVGGVLLLLDGANRAPAAGTGNRIALFQFSSREILDNCVAGALGALKARGLEPGSRLQVQRYNAENDLPTANAIAKDILAGGYRLVVTFSTPCLQVMGTANRAGKMNHVFACVTDPYGAGVGITRTGHPRHLVGLGTFQPVREAFRLAREMNPNLKTVGVVWNPGEACSSACLVEARDECAKLGITLMEAPIDNSTAVGEAAASLTARGVQALWLGGDNTVEMCTASLVQVGNAARIPVFANAPTHARAGALFGLGADYIEVGRLAGDLAADVLEGKDTTARRVENVVPQRLAINVDTLKNLRETWLVSDAVRRRAAEVIEHAPAPATSKP